MRIKSPTSPRSRTGSKENGRNQGFRPSLNREASRLGDVRVRRPSSRALVPETAVDGISHRKIFSDKSSRAAKMAISAYRHQTEFLLARLQKAQCSTVHSK